MEKSAINERSGDLSIKNPQYAFLEMDYSNPNLNQSETVKEHGKSTSLINKQPANLLLNINWILVWLSTIPADVYCITIFVISKYL
ncbi:hypothetical protein [Lysinibacillus endophyticus]|uniref:hypothetical protein n=1 Tax=Ureibacillus endophyticus TaxID=1978490 RepID=UPI00209CA5FD|nr:hypothetical protein [Lysinibacillus endophyticus]MCP1146065.1 hypothetical protein [Lysinibacillus endophyticus]